MNHQSQSHSTVGIEDIRRRSKNRKMSGRTRRDKGHSSQRNNRSNHFVGKPQDKFRVPVDNSKNLFVPRIKSKPNALVPLDVSCGYSKRGRLVNGCPHPYEHEISSLTFSEDQINKCEPINWLPLDETPLHFVDTIDHLNATVAKLKLCTEIAVDLEGHTRRSYLGLTCTLQISTRDEDFILDTLELRDDLHVLNEVFTDPKIVKVLHGAIADICSLQRDLAVYIVNMFDTYEAAQALTLDTLQLRGLVQKYCNVTLDKSLRTSDWRTRPLSDQQILYARQDTHYLLYIYDVMKNALLDIGYVTTANVYITSQNTCKTIYEKPKSTKSIVLYNRMNRHFDDIQLKVFDALVEWRDQMARECDESLEYFMPIATLTKLAEALPRTEREMLDCCAQPFIPNMVKRFKREIVQLINQNST